MKRIFILILSALLLCGTLTSCGIFGSGEQQTQHVHEYSEANCKDPQKCSCGATKGETLNNHSFENGVCTICEKTLINELGRLAKAINESKKEQNESLPYSVSTESHYANDTDIVSVSFGEGESWPSTADPEYTDGISLTITITQEGLESGVYEWQFTRRVYIKSENYYDGTHLFGTVTAADFSNTATLTTVEKPNYKTFDDAEKSEYLSKATKLLDKALKTDLIPLLADNESGLTAEDLGFVNYK